MRTLMFGNGINLLNDYSTWSDLLTRIDDRSEPRIPNTLQYEAEVLSLPEREDAEVSYNGDGVLYNGQRFFYSIHTESKIKSMIASAMKDYHGNEVYDRIASLPYFTHYLTTNYDQVLQSTLTKYGYTEYEHIKVENTYSLRRRHSFQNDALIQKHIWNIHGEIAFPQTIMLGLHQYCGSVGKISDLLNGKYTFNVEKKEVSVPPLQERLNVPELVPFSWIDLFFTTDVFILGFGLQYEETDIWWLLTRRKRMRRQGIKIKNTIFFIAAIPPGKRKVLETMDVVVVEPPREYVEKHNYFALYMWALDFVEYHH